MGPMALRQFVYLVSESFRTLSRHKAVMTLSVIIMSLTLLVLAVFLLATDNVLLLLDRTQQDLRIYVYLEDGLSSRETESLHRRILSLPRVETVVFVSKEEALGEFREELGEDQFILETLETNPLPASFQVAVRGDYNDAHRNEAVATEIAGWEGVEDVSYGREFVERFSFLARVFVFVDVVLGVIALLSAIFVIANTVRLTILSRQKTIEILKLVGATNRFISTPFILEGAFQGGLAACLSLLLLFGIYVVTRRVLPDLAFLPPEKIFYYLLTCILLGSLGSYAALRRFLRL